MLTYCTRKRVPYIRLLRFAVTAPRATNVVVLVLLLGVRVGFSSYVLINK